MALTRLSGQLTADLRARRVRPVAARSLLALTAGLTGLAVIMLSAGPAAAEQTPAAVAAASVLTSPGSGEALMGAATTSVRSKSPGTTSDALNSDLLAAESVRIGDTTVGLDQLIDFGSLAPHGSSSHTASGGDLTAISGRVSESGEISIAGPSSAFGSATLDLLMLAQSAGRSTLTDLMIDQLELRLGGFGSEVMVEGGVLLDHDRDIAPAGGHGRYRLDQADLLVRSPLVGEAAGEIYATAGLIDAAIDQSVTETIDPRTLAQLPTSRPGAPRPTIHVDAAMQDRLFQAVIDHPLTSANRVVTMDFSTGELQIHLDQLTSNARLDDQRPGTELLTPEHYPRVAEGVRDIIRAISTQMAETVTRSMATVAVTVEYRDDYGPVGGQSEVNWSFTLADAEAERVGTVSARGSGLIGGPVATRLAAQLSVEGGELSSRLVEPRRGFDAVAHGSLVEATFRSMRFTAESTITTLLAPTLDALSGFVSVQVNRQLPTTCETAVGDQELRGLRLSAVSLGMIGVPAEAPRLDLATTAVRFYPDACRPLP